MGTHHLKKQDKIVVYTYAGYPIIINKHSDRRNVNMFSEYLNRKK